MVLPVVIKDDTCIEASIGDEEDTKSGGKYSREGRGSMDNSGIV